MKQPCHDRQKHSFYLGECMYCGLSQIKHREQQKASNRKQEKLRQRALTDK